MRNMFALGEKGMYREESRDSFEKRFLVRGAK